MSVYKHPKSPFYRVDFQIENYRRRETTRATNEKDALAIEKELKAQTREEIKQLQATGRGPITIEAAADRYWEEVGKHHKAKGDTWHALGMLEKFFGKTKRIDQITDADLVAIITWRREQKRWGRSNAGTVSNATVNRHTTSVLKKIFMRAKKTWKISLPNEPNWKDHWLKEPEERICELHAHESEVLDVAVRDDYAPWLEFVRQTGLRHMETLIQWPNVNWGAKQINVIGKGGQPLTRPITPSVEAILKACMGHHPVYVFTYVAQRNAQGKVKGQRYPITKEGSKSEWRQLVKRSGLESLKKIGIHGIRHDVATKLMRATRNPKLVQKALGHRDMKTTMRYTHVLDEEVADGLELVAKSRREPKNPLTFPLTKSKKSG